MELKNLPIGIQTISDIIDGGYTYVDKTAIAHNLITKYKYAFLSRPRRFGKSLFVDTLHQIFEGNQKLFEGLAIYDKWDWSIKYPVIRFDFSKGSVLNRSELDESILRALRYNQERLDIECIEDNSVAGCFEELIHQAYKKYNQKVVILVDEYDKPILDNIAEIELAEEIRRGLVNLYSVIKGSDSYIRFAFLTGISKFSKASIFSGLNNLEDISLNPNFGDICGYTQNDLVTTFAKHLDGVDMTKVREWYNGYNFLGSPVYNPFDILQFIRNDFMFLNYWFESGTPSFLVKMIEKNDYYLPELSSITTTRAILNTFDIKDLKIETLLFQSGYLTIEKAEVDEDDDLIYTLKIPNREVRAALNEYIITKLYKDNPLNAKSLSKALRENSINNFITALKTIFASIPYHNYTNNHIDRYEGFYSSIVYVYLQSLGLNIIGEDVTNRGRIDLSIIMPNSIYIIEFKMASSKEEPIKQIIDKNYPQKYTSYNKPIHLVGIVFDEKQRNITKYEVQRYDKMELYSN